MSPIRASPRPPPVLPPPSPSPNPQITVFLRNKANLPTQKVAPIVIPLRLVATFRLLAGDQVQHRLASQRARSHHQLGPVVSVLADLEGLVEVSSLQRFEDGVLPLLREARILREPPKNSLRLTLTCGFEDRARRLSERLQSRNRNR